MSRHLTQIFWGLLILFLSVKINEFDCLDGLGCALVTVGCNGLSPLSPRFAVAALAGWAAAVLWVPALVVPGEFGQACEFAGTIIQFVMIWQLLGGVHDFTADGGRVDLAGRAKNRRLAYVALASTALLVGPSPWISSDPAAFPALVLGISIVAVVILILHLIYRVRAEFNSGRIALPLILSDRKAVPSPWQFSLRSLLITLTLVAVCCTYWLYYQPRPATASMTTRTMIAQRDVLERILAARSTAPCKRSSYAWVLVQDRELATLLGDPGTGLVHTRGQTIHMWPGESVASTYVSARRVPMTGVAGTPQTVRISETNTLAGFVGIRRVGRSFQFRIEWTAGYEGSPEDPTATLGAVTATNHHGAIDYNGPLPKGHLVFFAPVNTRECHVLVVDVEPNSR